MNKTININLAGIIFHLDEDAFLKLQQYLNQLRSFFKDSEGRDEIISDIEARFAELFQEKLNASKKEVISMVDVNAIIVVMGEPEAYLEDEDAQETYTNSTKESKPDNKKNRRLFRDPEDKVLGGVCGGLGAYFGVEPLIFRLLFVLFFFGFGTGFLLYILLWVLIPEANSAKQKLQMRGEDVNASNIGKVINDEVENLKGKFRQGASNFEEKVKNKDFRGIVGEIINGFAAVFGFVFRMVFKLFGFAMLLIGLFFAVSLLATLFGAGPMLFTGDHFPFNIGTMTEVIFLNGAQLSWAWIAISIFMGIPILYILYTGIRMIFKTDRAPKGIRIGAGVFWIISVIMLFGVAVQIGMDFDRGADFTKVVELDTDSLAQDTLILGINEDIFENRYRHDDLGLKVNDGRLQSNNLELDIKESPTNKATVRIRTSARGGSRSSAFSRAKNIEYQLVQTGNTIRFNDYFSFDTEDKWRDQEVYITLFLPEGMTVYLNDEMEDVIYDIKNTHNMWDGDMLNHYWEMRPSGLTCVDCQYYR
ncbi:MAG: phage shock protein PspC (stress-responsive transcriptional regulator) [Candidatus Azotimanducaceae bacterium]|jgi:phage shock protein PspC (stress-responsive transcriptional regulator)